MLFRREEIPDEPVRPSHFREDPNERTNLNEATLDYPDTDQTPDVPEDYGFPLPERSVPVYLTEPAPSDRTLVDWSSGTYTADTVRAVQVGSAAERGRRRIVVRNLDDANAVFVLRSNTDQNYTGYKIPAGSSEEFLHNSAVWVRAETADVEITVFAEFDLADLSEVTHRGG